LVHPLAELVDVRRLVRADVLSQTLEGRRRVLVVESGPVADGPLCVTVGLDVDVQYDSVGIDLFLCESVHARGRDRDGQ